MSKRELLLETCEDRILCSAAPNVTLSAPANAKIGDKVTVTATFDNKTGDRPGFGPYIDLIVDKTGADGYDGLDFSGASYLKGNVTSTTITFDAQGHATHPYAKDNAGNPLVITAPAGYGPGDQLIVLQLPFGSFTPQQPAAAVDVTFTVNNKSDLDKPLTIAAAGGFQYGNDALDNPTTDPSLVQASYSNTSVTPKLFTLTKTYLGPEDETATGPNYLQQYRIDVDIANGQTVTNLQLSDVLPPNMQFYLASDGSTPVLVYKNGVLTSAAATATPSSTAPSATAPGNTLTRTIATVTGDNTTAADASMTFYFYVPRVDATGGTVINATTGATVISPNDAKVSGNWTPIDTNDAPGSVTLDPNGPEHTLNDKSIATQKTVAIVQDNGVGGLSPGDVLEYTIQVQVSDYFAFNNLSLTDLLSDGQHLDQSFTPTLSFSEHNVDGAAAGFSNANWTANQNFTGAVANGPVYVIDPATNNGTTSISFRLSNELVTRGQNDDLVGGGIPNGGTSSPNNQPPLPFGATTATIKFRVIVQDRFSDSTDSTPQLSPRDVVTNNVTVQGTVLNVANLVPNGNQRTDTSATSLEIAQPVLTKTIYAINGVLVSGSGAMTIRPGDLITYRLQYTIPTGDIANFALTDFLPLPVFDTTTFNLTYDASAPTATAPGANVLRRGPTDNFTANSGLSPAISEPGGNTVEFSYGDFSNAANTSQTVDLLFTVVVNNKQFADGLFLTNQARATEGIAGRTGTNNTDAIVQFVLGEPDVAAYKGVVGYNNTGLTLGGLTFTAPGTAADFSGGNLVTPAQIAAIDNSDATGLDAGDVVRFAIVAQNTGRSDAFDVVLADQVVPGYVLPGTAAGLNLRVLRGDGTLLTAGTDYTVAYTAATGKFTVTLTDNYNAGPGLGGLNRGTDDAGAAVTDGSNAIVVVYDATVATATRPASVLTNTASLTNFSNVNGGTDFLAAPQTTIATVTTSAPAVTKQITGTFINNTRGNGQFAAVIGETVNLTLTIQVPEGTTAAAKLTDFLGTGLALVAVDSVTASSGVTYTGAGTPTVTDGLGQTINYDFGTITNANTNNAVPETITIAYRAVVLDTAANQAGTVLGANGATFSFQALDQPSGTTRTVAVSAAAPTNTVAVVEPTILTAKSVVVNGSGTTGDAGDPVVYTVVLSHGANSTDAFDLDLEDAIPAGITPSGFTVTDSTGVITSSSFTLTGQQLATVAGGFDFTNDAGRTITIRITGALAATVGSGQTITNNATTAWTTRNGTPGQISTYNTTSLERTGADGLLNSGVLNDYQTLGSATLTIVGSASKSIVSTSEPTSAGTTVVPGEVIRYRLVSTLGEGFAKNLQLQDFLPSGLTFLNDGTAKAAFVSDGGGITSSTISGAGLNVNGNDTTIGTVTPTYVLTGSAVTNDTGGSTYVNGTPVYFNLGDVTNAERDANSEYVVVEFNAIVSNAAASSNNAAGTGGSDAGDVNTNFYKVANTLPDTTIATVTSNLVSVTVAEPKVTVTKTVNGTAPTEAGDTVSYKITLTNASGATSARAFDLNVTDLLDNDIDFATGTVTDSLGRGAATITTVGTQTQIQYAASYLDVGETMVITVTGKLKNTTSAGEVIGNTSTVTYSSLPGSGTPVGASNTTGSAAGTAGAATGERTGSGTAPNDYTGTSTVNITLAKPTIVKLPLTQTNYTIGNQVVYFLNVTLPEGVTENLRVNDLLPLGLTPLSYEVITNGTTTGTTSTVTANYNGSVTATGPVAIPSAADGQDVLLNLGNATTAPDGVATNNNFLIKVTAIVSDTAAAASTNPPLANVGQLIYRIPTASATTDPGAGADTTLTSSTNISVVEPKLQIVKTVSDAAPELGQTVTYTLTITHAAGSGATAYDLILRDPTPTNLTLLTGSITVAGATVTNNNTTGSLIDLSLNQLAVGGTITITYKATVTQAQAAVGTTIPNNVSLYYDTLGQGDANAVLTGTPDGTPDRDYSTTGTRSLTVNAHTVTGTVYNDADASGTLNGAETGINGVTVAINGTDLNGNAFTATTTTNASGVYTFNNLPAGTYTLTETQPGGYVDGLETVGTNYGGAVSPVLDVNTITNLIIADHGAATGSGYNFGETLTSSLAGIVYVDSNNNGAVNAGEALLGGQTVTLSGTDKFGQAVSLTATTNASGAYTFLGLRPGTYTLTETQPAGYLDGRETAGTGVTTAGTVVNNADSNTISGIVVSGNQTGINNLFGELQAAALSGFAYEDANNNGTLNAGETLLGNVAIALTGTDDRGQAVTQNTTTAADGSYAFTGLRPGTYILTETQPAGYLPGKNTAGSASGTTVNNPPSNVISAIPIVSNANAVNYNFGDLLPGNLAGTVFRDDDNSGAKNGAEPGLSGVTIQLTGTNDLGSIGALTTTTDANGNYSFGALRPGTYKITEVQPAAYLDGKDTLGTAGGTLTNDNASAITLVEGQSGTGYTFGELAGSSLSGTVYVDANNNGLLETGETRIQGVTVKLTGTDDLGAAVSLTQTTDATGGYTFGNLRPGTYTLTETQPAAYLDGLDTAGSSGGTAANPGDAISAITLASNTPASAYNFGELRAASVSGSVFRDDDNSGAQNGAEPGLAGVTVKLTGTNDLGAAVNLTTTTAANGTYNFANLRPGTYTVTETQPAPYLDGKDALGNLGGTLTNDQSAGLVLSEGTVATGYTFGELGASSLAGTVYVDANNNGVLNTGETRIASVGVTLTGTDDLGAAVSLNATTDASGNYAFNTLRPGNYTVTETQPATYFDGGDAAGTSGGIAAAVPGDTISAITLASNTSATGYTFGELRQASLSGTVFRDDNNDGLKNGAEPGIAGVGIALTGTDDLGQAVSLSTATLADGTYSFAGLRPGTYTVAETQPAGYLDGQDRRGTALGTLANDQVSAITLAEGTNATGYTFGELAPASLSGTVYRDLNDNGTIEAGETGVAGVAVALTGTNDQGQAVSLSTFTDGGGNYRFDNVRPGTYTLTETQPAGLLDGLETAGSGTTTAGTVVNNADSNIISNLTIAAGQTGVGNNFGELPPSSLAGTVYRDDNNNGVPEVGEARLGGVALTLIGTNDRGQAVSLTTNTDATGAYAFGTLRPGTYTLSEAQPAGLVDGRDTPGTLGGTAANSPGDAISGIVLPSANDATGYNFGELRPATVSGTVYDDRNNNGAQDAGEGGLLGVSVRLTGTDAFGNAVNVVTATDVDGNYAFGNLEPANAAGYTLTETQPAGYLDGLETAGTTGGTVSNLVDSQTISGIPVGPGVTSAGNLFGEIQGSSISGVIYRDLNNNGTPDGGLETGIAGVTVTLAGIDDRGVAVNLTAISNASGAYSFDNLRPSSGAGYQITETQPAGLLDGLNTVGTQGGTTGAPPNDVIATVPIVPGTAGSGNNFGELPPADLSGVVYRDDNNNGLRDAGEPPLNGVTVVLTGTNDLNQPVTLTTATDANGLYSFANLRPGTYTLAEVQPAGYLDGLDTPGTAGGASSTPPGDTVAGITLVAGQSGANYRFGDLAPSSLSGAVFSDANNNNAIDPGENLLGGVTLTLTGTDDLGQAINLTQVTDASGAYSFANLRPGAYVITETQPPVFLDGQNHLGTAGGTTSNNPLSDVISAITLPSHTDGTAYNFGELAPSSLSGTVYLDLNLNGVRDAGESAVPNVAIRLTGTNDLGVAVVIDAITDANGGYSFGDLRPSAGGYTITETQPANYTDGPDQIGTQGGAAGNDVLTTVAIVAGTNGTGNDFTERFSTNLDKSIASTSLASTTGSKVAIGEVVRYHLTATVPFGTLTDFQLRELLPAGVIFLNDGTAAVSLVSANGTSLTATGAPGSGSATAGTPTALLSDAAVSASPVANSDVYGSGSEVYFKLGTLTNADTDAATLETVVIEFNARVADVPANISGHALPNQFSLRFDSTGDGTADDQPQAGLSPVITTTVVEPKLHLGKTVDDTTPDIGQRLNFTLTLDHTAASTAEAFDLILRDAMPPGLTLDPASILVNGAAVYANDSTAAGLALRLDALPVGGTITITYAATVDNTLANVGGTFANNARLYWSSLPGDNSANAVLDGTPDGTPDRSYGATPGYVESGTPTAGNDDPAQDTVGGAINTNTITGFVYRDDAGTGAFAGGDARLGGVSLTLNGTTATGLTVNLTITTLADGSYAFSGLAAGSYVITEAQPAGYVDGLETAGNAGTTFGGTVSATLDSNVITQVVIPAQSATTEANYNFGETLNSALRGNVYLDTDNDGVRQTGETGLASVPLTLTGTDIYGQSVTLTTSTLADGTYVFDGLRPGDYTVTEDDSALAALYLDGRDTPGSSGGMRAGTPPKYDALTGIALGQGANAQRYNFAELRPSSLAGSVYLDANNDGVRGAAETGLAGVTVTLTGADDLGQPVSLTATTLADGNYLFTSLRPGVYTLTETQPAAYGDGQDRAGTLGGTLGNDTVSNIGLQPGKDGVGYTFGERLAGISGEVFRDRNANGTADAGDAGVAGVALTLLDAGGNAVGQTNTDANGNYSFAGLTAGNYTVMETQPAGYGISTPVTATVLVPAGGSAAANFGVTLSSLAGEVYLDADRSNTLNGGDSGLGGVTVTLTGTDARGQSVTRATTTAGDGTYLFTDLLSGTYAVTETHPAGFQPGAETAGLAGGTVAPPSITQIALPAGTDTTGYLFGETISLPPGRGALAGAVFYDRNANGAAEGGEPGLAGVKLTLLDALGNVVANTTTGGDGRYAFANLAPGNYTVVETQPAAYGSSTPNTLSGVAVAADNVTAGQDFGETSGSLAGSVYFDNNHDGARQAGERGIAGVTVTLSGTDFNGASVSRTATTAADGSYAFTEVLGGSYTVTETQPAGIADGQDAVGTAGGTLGDDVMSNVGLGGGINATGYLFGENPAALSGTVYLDGNRNAQRDPAETGIPGIELSLLDSQNNLVAATTSGADGSYAFANLPPGAYSVVETEPNGYAPTTPIALAVTVPATGLSGQDFGEALGSLSGRVYVDRDNSGDFGAGDSDLGGVVLTLTGTDANGQAVSRTATTGADGQYTFGGLLSGNYTLTETQPNGFGEGTDTPGTAGGTHTAQDQFSTIGFGAGVQATGYHFGERVNTPPGTGAISGTVFLDANRDGQLQGGETGLGGVTVELRDGGGTLVDSATTAPDGSYLFTNVVPGGGYQLTELKPAIYGNSTPLVLGNVTVPADDAVTGQNFGNTTSTLAGTIYVDRDGSGTLTGGDLRLGGVTVFLTGEDNNGAAVDQTAVTRADGTYSFTGLAAGTYLITEQQPAEWREGIATAGSASGTPTSPDTIDAIALAPGEESPGYDFSELGGSLTGQVYYDRNKNGVQDPGETGLGGVTVQLRDGNGQPAGTVQTAPDGTWIFANLPAGDYTVVETQPPAYGSSTPNQAGTTLTTDNAPVVTFGETLGSLTGTVYHDLNNNGALDGTEPRLANVTVSLTGTDVNGNQITRSMVTDGLGEYVFDELPAGTYQLTETQPANYLQGRDTAGTASGNTAVTDVISSIGLGAGRDESAYLFGERTGVDLVVTKGDGEVSVRPGQLITYSITVSNAALQQANGVLVTDQFPSRLLTFISASGNGVYDPATNTITWALGQLAGSNEQTVVLSITARVRSVIPAGAEAIINTVTVTDDGTAGADLNPADNTAKDRDALRAAPDLYVTKTDNLTSAKVGDRNTYIITGGNAGNQIATGTFVEDTLPDGVRFLSASNGGQLIGGKVVWQLGDLRPGASFSFTVTVEVVSSAAGKDVVNPVRIDDRFGSFDDPKKGNNSATDITHIDPLPVPAPLFAFDSFNNFSDTAFFRRRSEQPGFLPYSNPTDNYRPAILPVAPIYSGEADPGSTLVVELFNANGDRIGDQSVMVDSGGNWLVSFTSSNLRDTPASVRITELPAPYTAPGLSGHNLRNYFAPVLNPGQFSMGGQDTTPLDPRAEAPLLGGLNIANPLELGTTKYGGELLPSPGAPGGY